MADVLADFYLFNSTLLLVDAGQFDMHTTTAGNPGDGAMPTDFIVSGGVFAVTPKVTALQAIASKLTVDFDGAVDIGTPIIVPSPDLWEPQISGLIQGGPNEIIFEWTIFHPTLQSAVSKDDRISLVFDLPVLCGAPALSRINPIDPLPTSTSQVSAEAIDILWTLPAAGAAPTITLISTSALQVDVVWSAPITLTAVGLLPSNWTFTPAAGSQPITCSAVTPDIDGVTIHLTVTAMTAGTNNYTLHTPAGVVLAAGPNVNVLVSQVFSGSGSFHLASATFETSTTVLIAYTVPPDYVTALTPGNYNIDHSLNVLSAAAVLPASVLLTTSEMTPDVTYTVTVSNVTDTNGNPLT